MLKLKKTMAGLILMVMVVAGCSSSEGYFKQGYSFSSNRKVAVIDVNGRLSGESAKNQVADIFAMELLRKGFSPVERSQIQKILKEQNFQASDITSPDNIARAGRILNVPLALIISVPEYGEKISMTAKMVDVQTGEIVWVSSGEGTTGRTLATITGAAVGAVIGATTTKAKNRVGGGIIGGAAGGIAGYALSPSEEKIFRKISRKIIDTLPMP